MTNIFMYFYLKIKSFLITKKPPEQNRSGGLDKELEIEESYVKFVYDFKTNKLNMIYSDIDSLYAFNDCIDQNLVNYITKKELNIPLDAAGSHDKIKDMLNEISGQQIQRKEEYNLHYPPSKFHLGSSQTK